MVLSNFDRLKDNPIN